MLTTAAVLDYPMYEINMRKNHEYPLLLKMTYHHELLEKERLPRFPCGSTCKSSQVSFQLAVYE